MYIKNKIFRIKVIIAYKMKNYNFSRVGTSEAIRLLSIYYYHKLFFKKNFFKNKILAGYRFYIRVFHPGGKSKSWNRWLAGLIDGDGCFCLTKKGYASL